MHFVDKRCDNNVNNNNINDDNNSPVMSGLSSGGPPLATSAGPMSLSFAGCGFLGLYHVGVASCFREYAPLNSQTLMCGASAGALAAMALCLRLPLGESTSEILQVAIKARARALGPFHPSFDVNKIIRDGLVKVLPEDCHKRATGRLYISVTRVSDGKNVIISQFDSKEDLIKAIQCSCFIPFWSGIVPPKFHGISYMDGGMSDNLPIIGSNTITVSPFSGESDICPQDDTYNPFQVNLVNTSISLSTSNLYRLTRILFPAHPEVLSKMCQQGFDDALRFLQRNNKIACTRCLAIQSSFTLSEDNDDDEEEPEEEGSDSGYDNSYLTLDGEQHSVINCMNCTDCQYRRQIAVLDSLPDAVVQAIQEACDQVNKGVINWLFRHRPMKLLSILTIPYLLPIDITIVMFCKVWQRVPAIRSELKNSLYNLLNFLRSVVTKMESKRHQYSAKFSCQLAVTEFDYSQEGCPQVYAQSVGARKVSTINLPKRKITTVAPNPLRPTPAVRKSVEKAHSFNGGARKRGIQESLTANAQELLALKARQRLERLQHTSAGNQRKSYAGTLNHHYDAWPIDRRRSMIDMTPKIKPPERLISKMNFGFSFDLKSKSDENVSFGERVGGAASASAHDLSDGSEAGDKVLNAFRSLENMDQSNAIEIANKALDWERECLQKYREFGQREGTGSEGADINKMIDITKNQDALMAFYYTDENNRVKVTEIFNIGADDDTGEETDAYEKTQQFNDDEEDDGLREEPSISAPTARVSPQRQTRSMLSQNTSPSDQRRRKKSVLLVD